MLASAGLLACVFALQIPPPNAAANESESLRRERRTVLEREAERLKGLGDRLNASGQGDAAKEVALHLPAPPPTDGSERFLPLPEVVPAPAKGLASVKAQGDSAWRSELASVRSESARALFALATRATSKPPRHYALADRCLRDVLERDSGHAEARRLLGFVPHDGGWATPFAVREFQAGKTLHPVYGWVWKSWVPHLERGELPVRGGGVEGRETWGTAAQADAAHADWSKAWTIATEHFEIRTNVPLSEAIAFGRHLEAFHDLFESRFADVIGENLPLAQRLKTPKLVGEKASEPHRVSYYADRAQFAEALRPYPNADPDESLGFYLPPPPRSRSKRGQAFFFRDAGGQLDVTATLYHEASHQLLFESGVAAANDQARNVGNYWVFEGLGTYFETLRPQEDGSIRVGGLVGERNAVARTNLVRNGKVVPLAAFVAYDQNRFNGGDIYLHYQQASALATFLMDGRGGAYREGFLDYVKSACQGRLRRTSGRSLEDWVGVPYARLEEQFLAYLKGEQRATPGE